MSKTNTLKKTIIVAAAAGLVITTAWGTVDAGQAYTDSTVGISSAFDRYADELVEKSSEAALTTADSGKSVADTTTEPVAATAQSTVKKTGAASETQKEKTEKDTVKYPEFEGKCLAVAADYVNIRAGEGTDADIVGILNNNGLATVESKGGEWTKITSGACTGYISNDYLLFGDEAGEYAEANCEKKATVATETLNVRAQADISADCITMVGQGQTFDILSQQDGWIQIAVDDETSGYVSDEYIELTYDFAAAKTIEEIQAEEEQSAAAESETTDDTDSTETEDSQEDTGEQDTGDAQEDAGSQNQDDTQSSEDTDSGETEDNSAQQSVPSSGQTGIDVANYAQQFVGNPYVYGGNSLTNGTDCSGFVMLIYAQYGYSLPHRADLQADYGTRVDISSIEPGDILFYGDGYSIGHCAIYIGNGQIVHASNEETGIKISNYDYRTPMCAVRLIGQ